MSHQVRVLVVDDSSFMRRIITDLLQTDPSITVIETARDGQDGVQKALLHSPDVITLDIEMPKLDGYGALREIMAKKPTPVVMVSSHTREGAQATIRALALGAVDFVAKPSGSISLDMVVARDDLIARVKGAAGATPRFRRVVAGLPPLWREVPETAAAAAEGPRPVTARRLVVIGCSTGGPGALHQIIPRLPADLPAAVIVVQHMPPGFTRSLAQRLDDISAIRVKEAEEGDPATTGQVLIAPGGRHLILTPTGTVSLTLDAPLHGVRPAVDRTLESVLGTWGNRCVGVILTGMGYDGAKSMAALHKAGGRTIVEDASTCVVYGMPRVVVELGAADEILPVQEISEAIVRSVREG